MKENIEQFLNGKRTNRDGKTYKLFNSYHRHRDMLYLKQVLEEFYAGIVLTNDLQYKDEIEKQLSLTFDRILGVRIDEKDGEIPPLCFAVDDMKNTHHGKLDPNGGVTLANYQKYGGILLLVPALKTEIENRRNIDTNGTHTFFHELVHAMSVWMREGQCVTGLQICGKGIFDDLNEGFTEYVAFSIMKTLYEGTKFEESLQIREGTRISLVEEILSVFEKDERSQILAYFITGKSEKIIQMFENVKNAENQSLMEFLMKNFQEKNRSISNCDIIGHPQQLQDLKELEDIKSFLQQCEYENEDQQEIY